MKKNKNAFTLVEVIIWILIVTIIIIGWFQALSSIWIWKVRLIEKTNIEKDSMFFTEKLFDLIKKWWNLDYEEYFNRKVVWITSSAWHYTLETWIWNFWSWWSIITSDYWDLFYYCRSWNWQSMLSGALNPDLWCLDWSFNSYWIDVSWKYQRYGQYRFQFIDYNSNADLDLWDEDWNWNIIWDDDDEITWLWPEAFTWSTNVKEIYLISWDKKTRTFLRWNIIDDPNYPPWNCNFATGTWTWCLWNIQFLKFDWKDWWYDHDISWWSNIWEYDWLIDTRIINEDFTWWSTVIAWDWSYENYWLNLFPDNINVKDFQVFAYPNKDREYAWSDDTNKVNLSPYIRIKFSLTPSWENRVKMKWSFPTLNYSTTINLTDKYSR